MTHAENILIFSHSVLGLAVIHQMNFIQGLLKSMQIYAFYLFFSIPFHHQKGFGKILPYNRGFGFDFLFTTLNDEESEFGWVIFLYFPQSVCVGCISFLGLPSQITANWVTQNNKKFILTVLEAGSVNLTYQRSHGPSEGSREGFFPDLGAFPTSSFSSALEYTLQSLSLPSCLITHGSLHPCLLFKGHQSPDLGLTLSSKIPP